MVSTSSLAKDIALIKGAKEKVECSSLQTQFRQSVKLRGDQEALVCLPPFGYTGEGSNCNNDNNAALDGLRWTYSQLYTKSRAFATWLQRQGVTRQDCIITFLGNEAGFALALWAAALLRATFVPLDWRSAKRRQDLKHYLSVVNPAAILVHDTITAQEVDYVCREQDRNIKARVAVEELEGAIGQSWTSLSRIIKTMGVTELMDQAVDLENEDREDDVELIIFTSGTTNSPKGCPHTTLSLSHNSPFTGSSPVASSPPTALVLSPTFHQMGVDVSIRCWRSGAKVVMPSGQLEPKAIRKVIAEEAVTFLAAVPTMIQTLLDLPDPSHNTVSPLAVLVGGATVSPEMLEACKNPSILGAKIVYGGFGMSEASGIFATSADRPLTLYNGFASVGRVQPNATVKICDPDTRETLRRGDIGELHIGGPRVITSYLGLADDQFYVDDDGCNWMATGDQALLDDAENAFILGRYKDLIIRGGENIAPAAIEFQLKKISAIREVHVIGIADAVAGEVPVAIVQMSFGCQPDDKELRRHIARELGSAFAPEAILTFDELGLTNIPKTNSGKVKKDTLRTLIKGHLQRVNNQLNSDKASIEMSFATIWSHLLLEPIKDLLATPDIIDKADSLEVLRFQGLVKRQYGRSIDLPQLLCLRTIREQAEHFENLESTMARPASRPLDVGTPDPVDMVHAHGDNRRVQRTKILAAPLLSHFHLDWDTDVEAVIPMPDYQHHLLGNSRLQSWNVHISLVSELTEPTMFRNAIEKSLRAWPLLRSMSLEFDSRTRLFLCIRPTPKWMSLLIDTAIEIDNTDHLANTSPPAFQSGFPQSPLFRVGIVRVKSTGKIGATIRIHHAIYDAFSLSAWLQDVSRLLLDPSALRSFSVSYKHFADIYYCQRNCLLAELSVNFHRDRLKGLAELKPCFWPTPKTPGYFIGDDEGWKHLDGKPGYTSERRQRNPNRGMGIQGVSTKINLTGIQMLKTEYGISADIVVKAGLALFNMLITGQDTAVFQNFQAARQWPFLNSFTNSHLPDSVSIAGPTFSLVVNRIKPSPTELMISFLQNLKRDQQLLTQHAQAPHSQLKESLDASDAAAFAEALRGQCFDWNGTLEGILDPSGVDDQAFKVIQHRTHSDVNTIWDCGLLGPEEGGMRLRYDDCHLSHDEATRAVDGMKRCAEWLYGSNDQMQLITQSLLKAFRSTIQEHPFLAGTVAPYSQDKPWLSNLYRQGPALLEVRRVQNVKYRGLHEKGFPTQLLDGEQLCPLFENGANDRNPSDICRFRATFVDDCLLLAVTVIHAVCDGHGIHEIIKYFAKNLRKAQKTQQDVGETSKPRCFYDRSTLVFGKGMLGNVDNHPSWYIGLSKRTVLKRTSCTTFRISSSTLADLKHAATPTPGRENREANFVDRTRISTHDAIVALIWRSVFRARRCAGLFSEDESSTHFVQSVNCRKRLGLADSYLGNVVFAAHATLPFAELVSSNDSAAATNPQISGSEAARVPGLQAAALAMRTELKNLTGNKFRDFLAMVDKNHLHAPIRLGVLDNFQTSAVFFTSWFGFETYDIDFGDTLDRIAAFRVPSQGNLPSVPVVLPRLLDGSCLLRD
ncbi:MAG: hypothetical protein Q9191_002742 [Dirinaria sp. TL-2023a]